MIEETSYSKGADTTDNWGDGGEIGALSDFVRDVTF